MNDYESIVDDILEGGRVKVSNVLPSDWVEKNRMMTPDVSPIPGMFSYDNSPYCREIIDCLSPDHPARVIGVMKGAQIGFSTGVIEGGIGWIISHNPGNILFLVGHEDLVKDAMAKIDRMLDNSTTDEGNQLVRNLIQSSSKRARNTKSGDTDTMKEFPSGYMKLGIANHKYLRNISMQYGFIDDFESMKSDTKQSGSTKEMIEQRFAAYAKKMKLFYISTPELQETSNIEPVYLLGDQRKYHIPCPCCSKMISIEWEIKSELNSDEMAGIYWKTDEEGMLIEDSVGYICYKCGGFFDDSDKSNLIRSGRWIPTNKKKTQPGYYSYHISSLYAPTYMYSWSHYVRKYMEANPVGEPRDEEKWKTFVNLCLGQTYKAPGESIKASELQKNIRPYEVGTIPEKLSIADGNGKIILITMGADLNGIEDDARLDYEVVAWSESGVSYSIDHGSIGTFINRDKGKTDRERWTYRHGMDMSVWPVFEEIMRGKYETDTGRRMQVAATAVDSGHNTDHVYQFVDYQSGKFVKSVKGDKGGRVNIQADLKKYRVSREKPNLYLVESNYTKDILARYMSLKWDPDFQDKQPVNFLNFPTPSGGKYLHTNYFSHFEAEHKVLDSNKGYIWEKKSPTEQNHLFDCRLYADVIKEIFIDTWLTASKIKNGTWADFVDLVLNSGK